MKQPTDYLVHRVVIVKRDKRKAALFPRVFVRNEVDALDRTELLKVFSQDVLVDVVFDSANENLLNGQV